MRRRDRTTDDRGRRRPRGLGGQAFGFAGKFYTGQALGNYNGGILQTLDAVTWKPIRTTGGWLEGFVYWTPNLHSHGGYAIDDPNDADAANPTFWAPFIVVGADR